jgi:hypothetical protein
MPSHICIFQARRVAVEPGHHQAKGAWCREHGINPNDFHAASTVDRASRPVHARRIGELPCIDRALL